MKKLLIVQNRPTQFDVPLYNYLANSGKLDLAVLYTQTHGDKSGGTDSEINRVPEWDHVSEEQYKRLDLSDTNYHDTSRVVSLIVEQQPDYVLLSGYYPPLHRKLVTPLKRLGIPIGLRSDNTLPHSDFSGLKGIVKKLLLPWWLQRYTYWHPVGSLARDYLEKMSFVNRPAYPFSYNADVDWFAAQSERFAANRAQDLAEQGFSTDDFIVLGVLKWHPREDPLVLVDAFCQLKKVCPNARLILVGDGPLASEVHVRLAGLDDSVHFPGYVPYSSLPMWYALADVFVHPALSEPWGVSVNEALACGVPAIVSSGVGAHVDLIEPGVTGEVFPVSDHQALADILLAYSGKSREELDAVSRACQSRMADWNYETTEKVFLDMLGTLQ